MWPSATQRFKLEQPNRKAQEHGKGRNCLHVMRNLVDGKTLTFEELTKTA
jgi:hypothetical protein